MQRTSEPPWLQRRIDSTIRYRFNLIDRLFVPLLRYLVNRSPRAQERYELRLSRFFPASEIRYLMRAAKPSSRTTA